MSTSSPRLAQGALVNVMSRTMAVGLGFVVAMVAARLGPASVGVFALFTAVEAALLALGSGGGVALARRVSHFGAAPGGALSSLALASLGAGSLLALAVWGVSHHVAGYEALWLLALGLPCLLLTPNVSGLWLGQGRMIPLAWLACGTPALTLLGWGSAVLWGAPDNVGVLLASWVAARVVVSGVVTWVALQRAGWVAPDVSWLRAQLRPIAMVGLTNLVSLLNYKADVLWVEHFMGLSATGVYALAVMVAELLWFVSSSLSQAAFARIGVPERAQAAAMVVRVMHVSLLLLMIAAPMLWGGAVVVSWWLGPAYAEMRVLLAVLLPGVLAYAPASVVSAYFTNHVGRPGVPALMATLSLLINGVVCWIAVPRWGSVGAAWATTLSYGLTMVCLLTLFRAHASLSWREVLWPRLSQVWGDVRRAWAPLQLLQPKGSPP